MDLGTYFLKSARDRVTTAELERLAAGLEPKIATAIREALQRQKRAADDLDAIAEALRTGDVGRVLTLLDLESMTDAITGVKLQITNTVAAAGALAASGPTLRGAGFVFDALNPQLLTWLQTYSFDLIRQVNAASKEGVREALTAGAVAGSGPRETAVKIQQVVGLTESQARAVLNYRRELETFHQRRTGGGYNVGAKIDRVNGHQVFRPDEHGRPKDGIEQRRLRDFRYDSTLRRAIETRKPIHPTTINRMVAAYQAKYIKHRAKTIARTEALRATNYGILDAWRQAITAGKVSEDYVRKFWTVARDERACKICAPIPEMNPENGQRFSMPFATPKGPTLAPPIHPQCRCTLFVRTFEPWELR